MHENVTELKNSLLAIGLVIDNKFLDKYCNLILDCAKLPKLKFKTASHHIIPKYYFKHNNLAIDNSKKNKVNISHSNHLLAHYYLALCSGNQDFYLDNCFALNRLLNIGNKEFKLDVGIKSIPNIDLDVYQKMMEDANQQRSKNTTLQHITNSPCRGRKRMTDGEKTVYVAQEDIDLFLSRGYVFGQHYANPMQGKHHTEESKRKIREGHKNLTPWNKGLTGVNTGKKGRVVSEETKQKLRDANLGKHLSESTREKLSKKSTGRIWCNNGVEEKLVRDIPIGYVKGRLKLNKNK